MFNSASHPAPLCPANLDPSYNVILYIALTILIAHVTACMEADTTFKTTFQTINKIINNTLEQLQYVLEHEAWISKHPIRICFVI